MSCRVCKGKDTDEMVACEKCDDWLHFNCIKLTESEILRIDNFYCIDCEDKYNLMTTWYGDDATEQQKTDKQKHYYTVEEILAHKFTQTGRKFLIKWEGYDTPTWEPEKHLHSCLNLLQRYCNRNGLKISKIRGLIGAKNDDDINEDNWLTMDLVLETLEKYRKWHFKTTTIGIKEWTGEFDKEDGLYVLNHEHHGYVLLYQHDKGFAYIADGRNLFKTRPSTALAIRKLLKIRLIPVLFNKQLHVDDCGSSAILIGLEFIRHYRTGSRPRVLIPYPKLTQEIRKYFTSSTSKPIKLDPKANLNTYTRCSYCNRRFLRRLKATRHEAMCRRRLIHQ